MRTEHQASRTLVKSPPELWAECSDAGSLARHIGEFGEIRITRLEPETSVCWEAERASGTVEIEPSGWGTRVTLTAQTEASEVAAETGDPGDAEPGERAEPVAEVDPDPVQDAVNPPETESDSVEKEEEIDAKVAETTADSDAAVAADARPPGGRWKRLIARTRKWFGAGAEAGDMAGAEAGDMAGVEAGDTAGPTPPERTPHLPAEAADSGIVTPEPEPVAIEAPSPGPPEAGDSDPALASDDAGPPAQAEVTDEATAVDPAAVLTAALDSLGQAHHRPFSRA